MFLYNISSPVCIGAVHKGKIILQQQWVPEVHLVLLYDGNPETTCQLDRIGQTYWYVEWEN
jgi:hypothetical protein